MNTLQNELDRYKDNVSIYLTGRTTQYGNVYGIAFYYDDLKGKKSRKVITGKKEDLPKKREAFLSDLFMQKQEASKTDLPAVSMAATPPPLQAPSCNVTLNKAIGDFLKQYEPTVSYQTFKGEKTNTNNISRILGNTLVKDITFEDFQSLVNTIARGKDGKQASPKTVRNHIISFKRIMKYCRKKKWISADDLELIIDDIKIPTFITDCGHEESVKEQKALTCEEAAKVLFDLKSNRRYYLVAYILFLTGLRPQEFFALEKNDLVKEVDHNTKQEYYFINIRQALVIQDKNKATGNGRIFKIGTTKNKGTRRKVPATKRVFQYFDELEKLLISNGYRKKSLDLDNETMVMVDRNGNLMDEHAFGVNMVRYLQRNGDSKRFTLGMPRHFYQDQLDILGAGETDIEKAVGHVINSVAERNYKVNQEYIKRLLPYVEQLGDLLENALVTLEALEASETI